MPVHMGLVMVDLLRRRCCYPAEMDPVRDDAAPYLDEADC